MDSIEDERLKFFLKHQTLIEEWAAAGKGEVEAVDRFLSSCGPPVEEVAKRVEGQVWQRLEGSWPKIFLVRSQWFECGEPRVGLGLQWRRGYSRFRGPEQVVVGVWVNLELPHGTSLSASIKTALSAANLLTGGWQSSRWWPAWRFETPAGEFWNDLTPFRRELVASVGEVWRTFEPALSKLASIA